MKQFFKYSLSFLLIFLMLPFLFLGITFLGYLIDSKTNDYKILNEIGNPLEIGALWYEEEFTFSIISVNEVSIANLPTHITQSVFNSSILNNSVGKAYTIKFDFNPIRINDKVRIHACGYSQNDNATECPLPSSTSNTLSSTDSTITILTTNNTDYINITVLIPHENGKYYKKIYQFNLEE